MAPEMHLWGGVGELLQNQTLAVTDPDLRSETTK
jgi:hypothetical protein